MFNEVHDFEAVSSSWVDEIAWGELDGEEGIAVKFLDGAICFYPGTDEDEYFKFMGAGSKGQWVWEHLYGLSYILV